MNLKKELVLCRKTTRRGEQQKRMDKIESSGWGGWFSGPGGRALDNRMGWVFFRDLEFFPMHCKLPCHFILDHGIFSGSVNAGYFIRVRLEVKELPLIDIILIKSD